MIWFYVAIAHAAEDAAVQGAGVGPALVAGPATAARGPGPTLGPVPVPRPVLHGGASPSRRPGPAPVQSPSPVPEAVLQLPTKVPSRGQDRGADPSPRKTMKLLRPEEKVGSDTGDRYTMLCSNTLNSIFYRLNSEWQHFEQAKGWITQPQRASVVYCWNHKVNHWRIGSQGRKWKTWSHSRSHFT